MKWNVTLTTKADKQVKKLPTKHDANVSIKESFADLINQYSESGVLLKGLRAREGMTQIEFAKKINITQANLSAMETGKRPIGKEIAKRISKKFKINYRLFL